MPYALSKTETLTFKYKIRSIVLGLSALSVKCVVKVVYILLHVVVYHRLFREGLEAAHVSAWFYTDTP